MATNKTRRSKKRHSKNKDKDKNILEHDTTKKSHRNRSHRNRSHRNRIVSSWNNHYTYESDNDTSVSNITSKNSNKGNIVNGLRDFLAAKK